jgi:hypothetical protein
LALCTKALRGWPEEVFNKKSTGVHALLTPESIVESIAYLIANPVAAGAVRYARDWPGAQTLAAEVGTRVATEDPTDVACVVANRGGLRCDSVNRRPPAAPGETARVARPSR